MAGILPTAGLLADPHNPAIRPTWYSSAWPQRGAPSDLERHVGGYRHMPGTRRHLLIGTSALLGWLHWSPLVAQSPTRVPTVVGACFDIVMGAWTPTTTNLGGDTLIFAPPSRIQMDSTPAQPSDFGLRVSVPPGSLPSVHRFLGWQPSGDSIDVMFSTKFAGLRMRLGASGDDLVGMAKAFTDFNSPQVTASVMAHRVACDAPQRPRAAERILPRAVLMSDGDSIAIGAPAALAVARSEPPFSNGGTATALSSTLLGRSRPVGLYSGATDLRVSRGNGGVVSTIRVTFPDSVGYESLVAQWVAVVGPPTSSINVTPPASPVPTGDRLTTWLNRTTSIALWRDRLVAGGYTITLILSDPRLPP